MTKANKTKEAIQRAFTTHNIYIKDISFEAPNTPHIFSLNWEPKVDFDLSISSQNMSDNIWEVSLNTTVKVDVQIHDDKEIKTAFIVEVKLAGAFTLTETDEEQADKILAITIPELLFPYLRETVSSLVSKGGFPSLYLPCMDFELLHKEHLKSKTKAK